jgi:cytochrome c5
MKRNIQMRLALAALIVLTTQLLAQTSQVSKSARTPTVKDPGAVQANIGQRKFEANCGRCHSAPEQLSPSITGTVVRHMRVRASLSAQDEKDVLKFLAP